MKYNPEVHHRRSIRFKGYDYSQNGVYFITVCTHNRKPYFEQYLKLRQIVDMRWQEIPKCFAGVTLDKSLIMPNHLHGIIIVGATLAVAQNAITGNGAGARPAPTIGEIVGMFKSLCVHDWLGYIKENRIDTVGKFWQRNYYEHIIRSEDRLNKIREYIINN
ncbi:MAG TPA: transposase, partial [Candidatus Hypogeohydataceae bacterium YC41]